MSKLCPHTKGSFLVTCPECHASWLEYNPDTPHIHGKPDDEEQEPGRKAFEQAVTMDGFHVNLTRIGPAASGAGEYADPIVQTCWRVWQLARDHYPKR